MNLMSCRLLKENGTYELENGRYKQSGENISRKVWVRFEDTTLHLYPLHNSIANKEGMTLFSFSEISDSGAKVLRLKKSSFDIDVLTIPFKYRPSVKRFPNQLDPNFSGALYAGHRNDFYRFSYHRNAIDENRRKLTHLGISYGMFGGISSTAITPWMTEGQVLSEYDGFLFMTGFGALVAVNNITFGLGLGVDFLLDKNDQYWIYQQKHGWD